MTKALVSGDWHGQASWLRVVFREAVRAEAEVVFQLGDFGVWPHLCRGGDEGGRVIPELGDDSLRWAPDQYLEGVSEWACANSIPVVFIDGNHDWHPWLLERAEVVARTAGGLVPVRENVLWAPRGTRFDLGDVSFLAMGGAYSIDKNYRVPGLSWWPEETITDEQVELARSRGEVDVLLSHDCPTGVNPIGPNTAGNKDDWPESYANRQQLRRVVESAKPRLVLHGHYHHRYSDGFCLVDGREVRVEGLDMNGTMQKNWVVLDLPSLDVSPRYPR